MSFDGVTFTGVVQWIAGGSGGSETYLLTRWIFLRALGVIYLLAFLSIWMQIKGLIGENGILPAGDFLSAVRGSTGSARFGLLPTVFWISTSNTALHLVCALGVVASIGLILGYAPMLSAFVAWVLYLSVTSVGQDFLSFQWDVLLLEVGFLAILFAPLGLLPGLSQETAVSPLLLCLLWFVLFRLTFESGVVKLLSGDPTWRDLTALNYHYFTTPLPTWVGYFVHQLPDWFHKISMVFMYIVELGFPFLIFLPGSPRLLGCAGMILLQILILVTGNYNFFNLLTILLCLLLIPDSVWQQILPEGFLSWLGNAGDLPLLPQWLSGIVAVVAIVVVLIGSWQLLRTLRLPVSPPAPLRALIRMVQPFHLVNSYGLFRVMTTSRPEIIVEGSHNGETWTPYVFKWKPGDPKDRPKFVQPHQPRLDWQMWFAALRYRGRELAASEVEGWFRSFLVRLLQGSSDVLVLLKENPFPGKPPRYVRATVFDYTFTDPQTKRDTGGWWRRRAIGPYVPVMALREG